MTEIRVPLADLISGVPRLVEQNGARVVLIRIGEQVHALADACAHQGGPLGDGKLSGTRLACPWHGWMYDVRTGQCVFPGRGAAVARYAVKLDSDEVQVTIP